MYYYSMYLCIIISVLYCEIGFADCHEQIEKRHKELHFITRERKGAH